jgi:hypothetical protein
MFRKRDDRRLAESAHATDVEPERRERRERRGEYARQVTRAVTTLLGAAAAGLLIWLATQIGDDSAGGYWAVHGLLAAAGLALALSQLLGGWTKWGWPKISAAVLLLGFLPVLIAGGWLLLAHQPEGAGFRGTALNWSSDIGLGGLVADLRDFLPVVAFGIGLVFGFTFDTKGPRVRKTTVAEQRVEAEPAPVYEGATADEPLAAERRTVPAATSDADAEPVGATEGQPDTQRTDR